MTKKMGKIFCTFDLSPAIIVLLHISVTAVAAIVSSNFFGTANSSSVTLHIFHWNNIQGHFYPSKTSGGVPGLVQLLQEERDKIEPLWHQNILHLSPGDWIGGEDGKVSFFSHCSKCFNLLQQVHKSLDPTIVTLSKQDFRFPLNVIKNVIGEEHFLLANYESRELSTKKWVIKKVKDEIGKDAFVGIVAFFMDEETEVSALISSLTSAILSAEREANHPIVTWIAVGDANQKVSQHVIHNIPGIKIIISGYSLGFESNGKMVAKDGLTVSAERYGKSLGTLEAVFHSEEKKLLSFSMKNIPNLSKNGGNKNATEILKNLTSMLHNNGATDKIGFSEFPITNENLGNIVADALARCVNRSELFSEPAFRGYSHKPIAAIWTSSSLGMGMEVQPFDEIRLIQLHKFMPFMETAILLLITGQKIEKLLQLLLNEKEEKVYLSEQFRVKLFSTGSFEGIFYPNGEKIHDDEELFVIIPRNIFHKNEYKFLHENAVNVSYFNASGSRSGDVQCLVKMFKELGSITWGAERRFLKRPNGEGKWHSLFWKSATMVLLSVWIIFLCRLPMKRWWIKQKGKVITSANTNINPRRQRSIYELRTFSRRTAAYETLNNGIS